MSGLQIEAGKFYRRRDGVVAGPMEGSLLGGEYPMWCPSRRMSYALDGRYSLAGPCDLDLVEEVPDPNAKSEPPVGEWSDGWTLFEARSSAPTSWHADNRGWQQFINSNARVSWSFDGNKFVDRRSATDKPATLSATDIAARAAELVGGDRDRQHGAKLDNFQRIATVWDAWLKVRKDPAAPLGPHDVGAMMVLMKMARTQSGSLNVDDYIDAAGYAACAGEVAQAEPASPN